MISDFLINMQFLDALLKQGKKHSFRLRKKNYNTIKLISAIKKKKSADNFLGLIKLKYLKEFFSI